jgi:uncharacterized membrane protein
MIIEVVCKFNIILSNLYYTIKIMLYIFVALVFYTLGILALTIASRKSDAIMVNAIGNIVASLIPITLMLFKFKVSEIFNNKQGVFFAGLSGLCIAIFGLAIAKAYSANNVGIVVPIVFGGSIFLSTILSYFIFGERVGVVQSVGLGLIFLGLCLVVYTRMYSV